MGGARVAQAVDALRRRGDERGHRGLLGVEEAQRVGGESPSLQLRKRLLVAPEVGRELGHVRRPAGRIADRVDEDLDVVEAGLTVEAQPELDQLGVDRGARVADRLHVPLPELAVATGLGPVVAEHRAGQGELHRLGPGLHPVLDVGATDAGRRLRPKRPALALLAPARRDAEELLLHDVRDLADPTLEDRPLLEEGNLDLPVSVAGGQLAGEPLQAGERCSFGGQEVAGAPGGAVGRHRRQV